ncbi:MAG: lipocalin family protein [Draconibacterium sp.]|nr:lipocalin family protein [Draconibacterium sp.]
MANQLKKMGKFGSIGAFVALVLMLSIACQKEEEPVDPIVGTWEYVESTEDFSRTVTLTFNADKSGLSRISYVIYGDTDERNNNFTYSTKNGILTIIIGFEITDSPYSISENQLTTTFQGDLMVLTRK